MWARYAHGPKRHHVSAGAGAGGPEFHLPRRKVGVDGRWDKGPVLGGRLVRAPAVAAKRSGRRSAGRASASPCRPQFSPVATLVDVTLDFGRLLTRGARPIVLPARFYVGGGMSGAWGGGGRLHVAPGELWYEPDRLLERLSGIQRVSHMRDSVTLVRARLFPPFCNTGLIILDCDRWVRILPWWGRTARITAAVRAAGYAVDERRTCASLGWRIATALAKADKSETPARG